uniref:Glycine-rich protein n=1 Tax=Cucumis sativus TaxID=3659 RepID=A0A0A0KWM3_CUCSA
MGRRKIALILILIYSSMLPFSSAFKQLFLTDNSNHQESEHMEKQYGRRYNVEGRHGYTNGIPTHIAITRGGGRGGGGGGRGNGAAGIHDQNCMKFIAAAVSISVAYLCGLI